MIDSVLKFFLNNRFFTVIILLGIIFTGIAVSPFDSYFSNYFKSIKVDAIPDLSENQQIVSVEWEGRSPQDVEDQITYPLTSALFGIKGVKTIRSTSMFGFSNIYILFEEDVDFYESRTRILEKISSLADGILPNGVTPSLGSDATAMGQIFWYTLEGINPENGEQIGGWDKQELRSIQDFNVKLALSGVQGVSEVSSIGGFVKEYQINIDPNLLRLNNIDIDEVTMALSKSNSEIGAKTLEINKVEYLVRSLGYFKNINEIKKVVIKMNGKTPILMEDIAFVSEGPANRRGGLDKNGNEAVGGVVVSRYGENPMEVIKNLKLKIEEISKNLPTKKFNNGVTSKLTIVPFYDRTSLIQETIGTLESSLYEEILISLIVVILMLMNIRASLVVSSVLPLGVLLTFIIMKLFDVQANIVALSGIAIAIGVMADVAIVVVENFLKHKEFSKGDESLINIIYNSCKEVVPALSTALLTTLVSFFPVFALEETEGKLFIPLGITKSLAIFASAVISLLIIPTLIYFVFLKKNINLKIPKINFKLPKKVGAILGFLLISYLLAKHWVPFGSDMKFIYNYLIIILIIGGIIGGLEYWIRHYEATIRWCLNNKIFFSLFPIFIISFGGYLWSKLGTEFMPSLDEGTFLYMPSNMAHAGVDYNVSSMSLLNKQIKSIPEVEYSVGKWGRVNSSLDPAPISMFENIIQYKPKYKLDKDGRRMKFKVDKDGNFIYKDGELIEDNNGLYFKQWRDHIKTTDDIWNEILSVSKIDGMTSSPKLQPIETRLIMLQSGMRSLFGIKISGTNLNDLESVGIKIEGILREVEGIKRESVFAERNVGKPYLEFKIDREKISRYGLKMEDVQNTIEITMGGKVVSKTIEGRERYDVMVRYARGYRDNLDDIKNIYINTPLGFQVTLDEIAELSYKKGSEMIKSENSFFINYVLFDKENNISAGEIVEKAQKVLNEKIKTGELVLPATIQSYKFSGMYENQIRAKNKLILVVPICLLIVFLIIYLQFRSVLVAFIHFTGVFVALGGGFISLWIYGLIFEPINLSVAVWVGFIALFGIATDDGILVGSFIEKKFSEKKLNTISEIKEAVIEAGKRRVRPALMTTALSIISLLPVLTSNGKGSEIMGPMALPIFGSMIFQMITVLVVPVLQCAMRERELIKSLK